MKITAEVMLYYPNITHTAELVSLPIVRFHKGGGIPDKEPETKLTRLSSKGLKVVKVRTYEIPAHTCAWAQYVERDPTYAIQQLIKQRDKDVAYLLEVKSAEL